MSIDYRTEHDNYLREYKAVEEEFRANCVRIMKQFTERCRLYDNGHHFVNYLFGGTTIWCVEEAEAGVVFDGGKECLMIHYRCRAVHGMGMGQSYSFDTCADKQPEITKEYLMLKEGTGEK